MKTNRKVILGIDPGYSGAAFLSYFSDITRCTEVKVVEFDKFLHKQENRKTKVIDFDNLVNTIVEYVSLSDCVVLESVKAMPRDGVTSAFNFGYFTGVLRGVIETSKECVYEGSLIKILNPTPQVWKSNLCLKTHATKEDSVRLAEEFFPDFKEYFYGPRGGIKDGIAEAALLSVYGLKHLYEVENG